MIDARREDHLIHGTAVLDRIGALTAFIQATADSPEGLDAYRAREAVAEALVGSD